MITLKQFTFNPYQENTYVLYDETGECVIIDPGMYDGSEQNILASWIKETKLKPVLLLNTHCHLDHVFGNKFVFDTWGLKPQFHKGELYILQAVPGYAPQMGLKLRTFTRARSLFRRNRNGDFWKQRAGIDFRTWSFSGTLVFLCKRGRFYCRR